jgi:hypothetical protein
MPLSGPEYSEASIRQRSFLHLCWTADLVLLKRQFFFRHSKLLSLPPLVLEQACRDALCNTTDIAAVE